MFELTPEETLLLVSQSVIPGLGKLDEMEKKYDGQFRMVFDALRRLMAPPAKPAKELGFHTLPSAHDAKKTPRHPKP